MWTNALGEIEAAGGGVEERVDATSTTGGWPALGVDADDLVEIRRHRPASTRRRARKTAAAEAARRCGRCRRRPGRPGGVKASLSIAADLHDRGQRDVDDAGAGGDRRVVEREHEGHRARARQRQPVAGGRDARRPRSRPNCRPREAARRSAALPGGRSPEAIDRAGRRRPRRASRSGRAARCPRSCSWHSRRSSVAGGVALRGEGQALRRGRAPARPSRATRAFE